MYVTPNVTMHRTFIARLPLGRNSRGATANTAAISARHVSNFSSHSLAALDFNPPLSSFTMSKIVSVRLRLTPAPFDVDWYAGIWCDLPAGNRNHDAVARRAPNVTWVWRSNVTVMQEIEHVVPWPHGYPVADSVHATMPGLHAPYLQIGFHNNPFGSATALPEGEISAYVILEAEVAGYGMLGTL